MPRPYSPESYVLPEHPADLLTYAAAHIRHVGLHQGGTMYATAGRIVELRASMLGCFDVAGGNGRVKAFRTYRWPAIYQARSEALRVLADHVNGTPVTVMSDRDIEQTRRYVIQVWGNEPAHTVADVAEAFAAAARLCRPDSPPPAAEPVPIHRNTVQEQLF